MSDSIPIKPASDVTRPKRAGAKPGRVDLVPEEFEALIEDQGTLVRITPSILCPNRTSLEDTNHVLDCPICFGTEVVDLDDKCIEDWAFIQGIDFEKMLNVQGIYDQKDARITVKQGIRLYYWYKIEVIDFASVYNQLLKRGGGERDRLRYKPTGNCDTPYYCIAKDGTQFTLNEDYKIVDDRYIKWISAKRPLAGELYSFVYPILPTFRVMEMMHENRYYYTGFKQKVKTPVNLPQQAHIRWDYAAKRSGTQIEIENG
jgi:hypothetical protein